MRRMMLAASAMFALSSLQDLAASPAHGSTDPSPASASRVMNSDGLGTALPVAIPDNTPSGVLLGPFPLTNELGTIQDVSLELSISHPSAGDVVAWLYYDADNDGIYDAETPIEFYLARSDLSAAPAWSHSIRLDKTCYFRHDTQATNLADWDTGNFASFHGLPGGGHFYIRVADTMEGDVGTVRDWAVHVSSDEAAEIATRR